MAQRDNRHSVWVLGMHDPAAGATRRCPMQPSTPLGPDQVNVLLLFSSAMVAEPIGACCVRVYFAMLQIQVTRSVRMAT
jgi:hypothetical protein